MKNRFLLLFICILGSIVRFYYGYNFKPWLQAPDQLAWELVLNHGDWTYAQLIHYPHEGGTILISIIARFAQLFTDFHPLTVVAFVLDFIVRFIQLFVISKLFSKKILTLFGAWTVFALPYMIPWGTLNFGLHYISAVFPFIYLWLNSQKKTNHLIVGLFLGFAFWFHYSNLILILVYLLSNIFKREPLKKWVTGLISIMCILGLHLITRFSLDAGFHLDGIDGTSIRGTEFMLSEPSTYKRLYQLWFNPLSDSILSGVNSNLLFPWTAHWWTISLIIGCLMLFIRKSPIKWTLFQSFSIMVLFFAVYAISPFYYDGDKVGHYVLYRHLCTIVPFAVLLAIIGLSSFKLTMPVAIILILFGNLNSILSFNQTPTENMAIKPAAWVLATKFGHNPTLLTQIIEKTDLNQQELLEGIGWGTTTALFHSTENQEESLLLLKQLYDEYPVEFQESFLDGVEFAFSDQVNPRLDKSILKEISFLKMN